MPGGWRGSVGGGCRGGAGGVPAGWGGFVRVGGGGVWRGGSEQTLFDCHRCLASFLMAWTLACNVNAGCQFGRLSFLKFWNPGYTAHHKVRGTELELQL